jgi:hypothetical protein
LAPIFKLVSEAGKNWHGKISLPMTDTHRSQSSWLPWFFGVGLVALAQRVVLWLSYPPAAYNDSVGYRRLAQAALDGWRDFNGTRVPGYAFYMAWVGPDLQVYLSQLCLGFAITLLFFFLGWRATRSPVFGAIVALAHTLNLGQFFFEANLLSETLATFCLLLVLVCVWLALQPIGRWRWLVWLGIGILSAIAGLTRSLYLFIPFWTGLFLAVVGTIPSPFGRGQGEGSSAFGGKKGPSPCPLPKGEGIQNAPRMCRLPINQRLTHLKLHFDWRPLVVISLPALLLIGLWVNYVYQRFGVLSVTTMNGFHLVQHTGQWFELLPGEGPEGVIRDVFLEYRATQIAETGSPGNTIWDAQPAIEKATGLGFVELSNTMLRLSLKLIAEHPDRYLLSVLDGWQLYWRAPVYWRPQEFTSPAARTTLTILVDAERLLLIAANLAFLVTSALALFSRRWRQRLGLTPWWVFVASTLWVTSILQSLPDHGDNPRFLIPMQSWVVLWVIWVIWVLWRMQPPLKNVFVSITDSGFSPRNTRNTRKKKNLEQNGQDIQDQENG